MTVSLDSTATATINSSVRGAQWLVELDFVGGTVYFTTNAVTVTINGHTYSGLGNLISVGPMQESEDPSPGNLVLSFSIVSTAMLAATLGSVENYRGKAARLYLQLINTTYQPAGAPVLRWSGYMGPVNVKRQSPGKDGGASHGTIELPLYHAGMARSRNRQGTRLSHAQQTLLFPGDNGAEYIQPLIDKPTLWLSRAFQQLN